jgi:hypothetical protein
LTNTKGSGKQPLAINSNQEESVSEQSEDSNTLLDLLCEVGGSPNECEDESRQANADGARDKDGAEVVYGQSCMIVHPRLSPSFQSSHLEEVGTLEEGEFRSELEHFLIRDVEFG